MYIPENMKGEKIMINKDKYEKDLIKMAENKIRELKECYKSKKHSISIKLEMQKETESYINALIDVAYMIFDSNRALIETLEDLEEEATLLSPKDGKTRNYYNEVIQ